MATSSRIRFGHFELDPESLELFEDEHTVRLPEQSAQVLTCLATRPGELVTRGGLQAALWPEGSPVDVEHGLNAAVNRARDALGDSARAPRYIETVPRRGYRFIAPMEVEAASGSPLRLRWPLIAAFATTLTFAFFAVPDSRPITSLVVLPLDELSANPEEDCVAEAMTEAIISELSNLPSLHVLSRTTATKFRDSDRAVGVIARELGVQAVLEGSVRHSGGRVRLTVRLVGVEPERQLWSGSFERDTNELLALESDLPRTVVGGVHLALLP